MSIVREPFYGGVRYRDPDTGEMSEATYPTNETEYSAFMFGTLRVIRDDLKIWPPQVRKEETKPMTDEQKAAYVMAQSVAAMAEIEAMKAFNYERAAHGYSPGYGEEAFLDVIEKYGLHHNVLLEFFSQ